MEVGLFVLGILVGIGVCGYLLERHGAAEADEREANFQARLAAMQSELKDSDSALVETRDRLIALQLEQARDDAESPQSVTALVEEVARLKRELAAATGVPPAADRPADDLTLIKGIGKVIERRLRGLGITTYRQLAELSTADIQRINNALDFPGRIERERWVEQARSLSGT